MAPLSIVEFMKTSFFITAAKTINFCALTVEKITWMIIRKKMLSELKKTRLLRKFLSAKTLLEKLRRKLILYI